MEKRSAGKVRPPSKVGGPGERRTKRNITILRVKVTGKIEPYFLGNILRQLER